MGYIIPYNAGMVPNLQRQQDMAKTLWVVWLCHHCPKKPTLGGRRPRRAPSQAFTPSSQGQVQGCFLLPDSPWHTNEPLKSGFVRCKWQGYLSMSFVSNRQHLSNHTSMPTIQIVPVTHLLVIPAARGHRWSGLLVSVSVFFFWTFLSMELLEYSTW